jgi:hypothetical protein
MNGKQQTVLNLLLADFTAKRGFSDVGYRTINTPINNWPTQRFGLRRRGRVQPGRICSRV